MNDYFARLTPEQRAAHGGLNPTPDTREKKFKGQRDAKKKAYAADAPARAARAVEEQARAKARAKARAAENKALAEARADTTEQALADACVEIKFRTPHA